MDIPVAIPVNFSNSPSPEQYELDITQTELRIAEQKLKRMLDLVQDLFASPAERDCIYQQIKQNPTKVYQKPFMNKIAKAIVEVNRCKQAVQWASEALEDTRLTPAKVKTQVKRLIIKQALHMENKMETQMIAMITQMKAEQQKLKQELEIEKCHRIALQSQVSELIRNLRG
jgi:hypothetical protein